MDADFLLDADLREDFFDEPFCESANFFILDVFDFFDIES